MQKQLLVLMLCWASGLTACQPNDTLPSEGTEVSASRPIPEKTGLEPADTAGAVSRPVPAAIDAEQITSGMLVFEGLPSKQITVPQLIKQLGRPDSVARGVVECGSILNGDPTLPGDIWYYGLTKYQVADNQAGLSSMAVRNGRFSGKLGRLVLNQRTTLQDVAQVFPKAAQRVRPAASSAALQEVSFTFRLDNGETADGALELIFDHDKLISVDFWFPC